MAKNKELWQITYNWLRLYGSKVNSKYIKEEMTTHPDYPALTSVVDFLDQGRFAYRAVQADASYIHEFNYPLLAHIRQPGQEYLHLINNAAEWDQEKEITRHWSGIVVYPEKKADWQSEQNGTYLKNEFRNKLFISVLVMLGIVVTGITAFQLNSITTLVFGFLSLSGVTVSLFLLGTELGFQSEIVKQFCGAVSNGGCEKVLKSRYAKGIGGITPADTSVIYFAAQFLVFQLSYFYPQFLVSIVLLSFGGIAVAAWSIYTQAVKLKQYCALCLSIVAVLVVQSIAAIILYQNNTTSVSAVISASLYEGLGLFALLYCIAGAVLIPVKQLIKTNRINTIKLAELKKWKLDAGLFINQWQQEQKVDTTVWENDLLIGNPDAPVLITVACNPYCGPCAKAHHQLDDLLERYKGKLKVQLRLLCNPENDQDRRTIAVNAILQKVYSAKSNKELQQLLSDWFEWMDMEKWNAQWNPDADIDVKERMHQHSKWVDESAIAFTPTFFINGKKMPGRYSLADFELLIPQLAEMMNKEVNVNN